MSSSDTFWLSIWEVVAAIGFIIVIIGVVIEGVEHFAKFTKKEHSRKLRIEKLGWFLVVLGLAMEFLGDHAAKRISDREAARLNAEAGDARRIAGDANERAANTESNNLVLRSNVVILEKELLLKTFTHEQKVLAHEILGKYAGIPFVLESFKDTDSTRFGERVFDLLNEIGWEVGGHVTGGDVRFQKTGMDIPRTQEPVGIEIVINKSEYQDAANALDTFLKQCDIKSKVVVNLHPHIVIGGDGIHVRVGSLQ